MKKHRERIGQGGTGTHVTWLSMRARCLRKSSTQYKWYGARGIKICRRWSRFSLFLADMGERPAGKCLDRIDNNGNYEPRNCKWSTRAEQGRNRRGNVTLTHNGRTMILADWAKDIGISTACLGARVRNGWDIQRTLNEEPGSYTKKITHKIPHKGKLVSCAELARLTGIKRETLRWRIHHGVPLKSLTSPVKNAITKTVRNKITNKPLDNSSGKATCHNKACS